MANGTLAASQIEMLSQSGTGIVTIVPPTTNTNRTLTLPDSTGTLLNTNGGTITGTLTVTGVTTLGNGAVLGVPASGTVTNLTGTASININGTVGATTPTTVAATTVIATGAISGHAASRVVMDYSPGGGRIWGYGVNAGTIGEVAIQLRSSDGSLGATAATFSSAGLAVTGTLSVTYPASTKAGAVFGTGATTQQGWSLGNLASATSGIWSTADTPSNTNYRFWADSNYTIQSGPTYSALGVAGSNVAVASSTGLAVTGALSATATGAYFTNNGVTTSAKYIQILNTNGGAYFGVESSAGGAIITGSTGYDAAIAGQSGIAFSGSNGSAMQMRLTSAGLAVTGTLSASGQITASATSGGVTFASTGGQNVRVYGGSASHQWDIYGNGTNLRFSDNTGGGKVVIDTALDSGALSAGGQVTVAYSGAIAVIKDTGAYSTGVSGGALYLQGLDSTSVNNTLGLIQSYAKASRLSDLSIVLGQAGSTFEAARWSGGATAAATTLNLYGPLAVTGALSASGTVTLTNSSVNQLVLTGAGTAATRIQVIRGTDDATQSTQYGWNGQVTERSAPATIAQVQGYNFVFRGTTDATPLALTYNTVTITGTLSSTLGATIQGLTVGLGAGAVASNTAVGASALAANSTGSFSTAIGNGAGAAQLSGQNVYVGNDAGGKLTTGDQNVGIGISSLGWNIVSGNTTGSYNTTVGTQSMTRLSSGYNNTALGYAALAFNNTGPNNTAVGYRAAYTNTTGTSNVAVGPEALFQNIDGSYNTAVGAGVIGSVAAALGNNSAGTYNTGIGNGALSENTNASFGTAVGAGALQKNISGASNTAVGYRAGYTNTTATQLTVFGAKAGFTNNANNNAFFGYEAGYKNASGTNNAAFGAYRPLYENVSGNFNTAIGDQALLNATNLNNNALGYQAGLTVSTGSYNVFIGSRSGSTGATALTGDANTCIGEAAGYALQGAALNNTFLGQNSGSAITTGGSNTILGRFDGYSGGLDIRTGSNYIVLADGGANIRAYHDATNWYFPSVDTQTTGSAANVNVGTNGVLRKSTSSLKYKRDIQDATHGLAEVMQLRAVTYKSKSALDGDTTYGGLIAEEVDAAGLSEFVMYAPDGTPDALAYGNMVSLCIKAMQEQQAIIESLKARLDAANL